MSNRREGLAASGRASAVHPRDELLTVAEAADESGFSTVTIRRHIVKGILTVVRLGPFRRIRIRRRDFERYLVPRDT